MKEFLVPGAVTSPSNNNIVHRPWKHTFKPQKSNRVLAQICIQYLLLSDFVSPSLGANEFKGHEPEEEILLEYFATYWAART